MLSEGGASAAASAYDHCLNCSRLLRIQRSSGCCVACARAFHAVKERGRTKLTVRNVGNHSERQDCYILPTFLFLGASPLYGSGPNIRVNASSNKFNMQRGRRNKGTKNTPHTHIRPQFVCYYLYGTCISRGVVSSTHKTIVATMYSPTMLNSIAAASWDMTQNAAPSQRKTKGGSAAGWADSVRPVLAWNESPQQQRICTASTAIPQSNGCKSIGWTDLYSYVAGTVTAPCAEGQQLTQARSTGTRHAVSGTTHGIPHRGCSSGTLRGVLEAAVEPLHSSLGLLGGSQ